MKDVFQRQFRAQENGQSLNVRITALWHFKPKKCLHHLNRNPYLETRKLSLTLCLFHNLVKELIPLSTVLVLSSYLTIAWGLFAFVFWLINVVYESCRPEPFNSSLNKLENSNTELFVLFLHYLGVLITAECIGAFLWLRIIHQAPALFLIMIKPHSLSWIAWFRVQVEVAHRILQQLIQISSYIYWRQYLSGVPACLCDCY